MFLLNSFIVSSPSPRRWVLLILLLGVGLLWACGVAWRSGEEMTQSGGTTPEEPVDGFLRTLNQALQDPQIVVPEVRRSWAARLASFFLPSDRDAQQLAMGLMLRNFALSCSNLKENETLTVEIRYEGVHTLSQDHARARVQVVNGRIYLRRVVTTAEGRNIVLRDQEEPLGNVLGLTDASFPVVQQEGRWFLTE